MRLTDAATRPHHGIPESVELLYERDGAQKYDEEAIKHSCRGSVQERTTHLFRAGENDARPGQRTPHAPLSKHETSRLQKRDWPHESFVSPLANTSRTYTRLQCPLPEPLPFTQVRCHALSALIVLLHFLLFTVILYCC